MELPPPGTIEAFGLHLVRTGALVLAAPLLGTGTGFGGYKVALIAAVSFLLYGAGGEPLASVPEPAEYVLLALRETVIGLSLAFCLHAVMVALRVAGEMIGHEMAFNMATLVDPNTGQSTPVITQVYEVFFFLGLLMTDAHHLLFRALTASFGRAPVGSFDLSAELPWLAERLFTQAFAAGITFAAPVLVLLAVVSMLMGLLARAVPQLNVTEVGFTARIAAGLVALYAFAPLLGQALEGLYARLADGLGLTLDALGA